MSHLSSRPGRLAARLAALAAATILLIVLASGAVLAGASLLAGDGPFVVDPDDPDAYQTISDAVTAAVDGDTVLVKPGTYRESVAISSDITLTGDGERGSIVLEFAADGPTYLEGGDAFAYGILIEDSDAHVSNLTIQGPADDGSDPAVSGVYVVGGAPLIEGIDIVLSGDRFDYGGGGYYRRSAVRVTGGSTATVRDSTWDGYVRMFGTVQRTDLRGQHHHRAAHRCTRRWPATHHPRQHLPRGRRGALGQHRLWRAPGGQRHHRLDRRR